MAVRWPIPLQANDVLWQLENQSRSGGASLTGSEQIVSSGAGRWRATVNINLVALQLEDAVLSFRALMAQLEGRVGEILLPAFDAYRPRQNDGQMLSDAEGLGMIDATAFDHSGFEQDDVPTATITASKPTNATEISLNLLGNRGPRPGNYLSIGDRLYIARHVWQNTAGGVTYVSISPRLRAPVNTGDAVNLDKPHCLMRLASDDTGSLMLEMRRYGQTSLDFVEVF